MASSFVEFNQYGFWSSDGFLQIWLHFLAQEVNNLSELPKWLKNIGDNWHVQSKGVCPGCIYIGLDEYATTPMRIQTLITVSMKALATVQGYQDFFSKDDLSSFDLGGVWTADVPIERIAKLAEQFIKLLKGEITSTASSPDSLPNSWQFEGK